ncbi:Bifunctional protein FolD, partial [Dissostichus eleginoides]
TPPPLALQQLPLFLAIPAPHARVSELSRAGSDITRFCQQSRGSSCQRQPVLCQASPRQAVIQPSSLHIKTHCRGGEGR